MSSEEERQARHLYIAKDPEDLVRCIAGQKNPKVVMWNMSVSGKEVKQIANEILITNSIKEFYSAHTRLGVNFDPIAKMLRKNTSIQVLNLKYDELPSSDMKNLANAMLVNTSVRRLLLRNNHAQLGGAKAFAGVLKQNCVITRLNLSANELTDEGGVLIADSLKFNSTLRRLYLRENRFSDPVAVAFANSLTKNVALELLDLETNIIGGDGATALARMIRTRNINNSSLTEMNLRGNLVSPEGATLLIEALAHSNSFRYLHLFENPFGNNIKDMLADVHRAKAAVFKETQALRLEDLTLNLASGNVGPWNRSKIMLVGEGRTGKSATVRSLLNQSFDANLESTVGVSLSHANAHVSGWRKSKLKNVTLEFLAHQVVEVREDHSLKKEEGEEDDLEAGRKGNDLIENPDISTPRTDNENGEVEFNEADLLDPNYIPFDEAGESRKIRVPKAEEDVWEKHNISREQAGKIIENAGKDKGLSFTLWDLGGQEVFYSLHHIFLTNHSIYLVLFNMVSMLRNTSSSLRYVKFWLDAINLHAPEAPVLLLGSHADKIRKKSSKKKINKVLLNLIGPTSSTVFNAEDNLVYFPFSNKTSNGISYIRETVECVAREQEYVSRLVPSRWMECLDELVRIGFPIASLDEVKLIAHNLGVTESDEVESMLDFFHELGVVMHLRAYRSLKNMIIFQPQFLIDKLSMIIRDTKLHSFDTHKLQAAGLGEDHQNLTQKGILSRDLADFLWVDVRSDIKNFLVNLMKDTMLISEWNFKGETQFVVSSLLPDRPQKALSHTRNKCRFDFSLSSLPKGVFQRLLCLYLNYCMESEDPLEFSELNQSWCYFRFTEPGSFILIEQKENQLYLHSSTTKARKTYLALVSMIHKINSEAMNHRLKWEIFFLKKGKYLPSNLAAEEEFAPWFIRKEFEQEKQLLATNLDNFVA